MLYSVQFSYQEMPFLNAFKLSSLELYLLFRPVICTLPFLTSAPQTLMLTPPHLHWPIQASLPPQSHHWHQRDQQAPPLIHGCCHSPSTPAFLRYKLSSREHWDKRHILWLRSSKTTWAKLFPSETETSQRDEITFMEEARNPYCGCTFISNDLDIVNQLCHPGNILLAFIWHLNYALIIITTLLFRSNVHLKQRYKTLSTNRVH